jgi:hypothetical protein
MENKINDNYASAVLLLCIASATGIFLLTASSFNVPLLLLISCGAFAGCAYYFHIDFRFEKSPLLAPTILILTIGILLRIEIYPHFMGGQDQGLYTNFSLIMLKFKGLFYIDEFRQSLPLDLQEVYDKVVLPGTHLINSTKSQGTILFYPLHPMWMAVFGWFLGPHLQATSLLFFTVFYLLGGKLIAQELFNSEKVGLLAMLLLATSPALVFFSKFPVTEMVALAFTINGLLFIFRAYRSKVRAQRYFYYLIAILCFNSFFYVRFSFLAFLPILFLVVGWCIFTNKANSSKSELAFALVLIFLLFGGSLIWFYYFQNRLFEDMFSGHIRSLISYDILASALPISILFFLVCLFYRERLAPIITSISEFLLRRSTGVYIIFLCFSLISIISLYKDGSLAPFPFTLDTSDPLLFRYHILYRFITLISPFVFVILIITYFLKNHLNPAVNLFVLLTASIWGVYLLQGTTPYLYYHSRYICSEIVPYSLIIVSGVFFKIYESGFRKFAVSVAILTIAYNLFFSVVQLGGKESEECSAFAPLDNVVAESDILLTNGVSSRILTPLRFFSEKKVFAIDESKSTPEAINAAIEKLWLMAKQQNARLFYICNSDRQVKYEQKIANYNFRDSFFSNGEHHRHINVPQVINNSISKMFLPTELRWSVQQFSIYDLTNQTFPLLPAEKLPHSSSKLKFDGWHDAEAAHRWSKNMSRLSFDLINPSDFTGKVYLRCWTYGQQMVELYLNQQLIYSGTLDGSPSTLKIEFPAKYFKEGTNLLEFKLPDARKPSSGDSRVIGLAIAEIVLE